MTNIDLASFSFDYSEIVKGAAEIKKEIERLKKQQQDLAKSGQGASEQFVRNAADLKTLNGVYNEHVKYLADASKQALDNEIREKALDLVLNQEAVTIKELREQNKQLNALRNTANLTTEEGKKELELLNAQLDKNNELIKENVDAYTKQKINIGNYTQSIRDALNEMNPFNASFYVFISRSQEAGGAGKLFAEGIKSTTTAMVGLTKATLAFIATPIGAVITALASAFLLIRNAMSRSEETTNKVKKAFAGISGVFNQILKTLEPVGKFLVDVLVKAFEAAGKAAEAAMKIISKSLNFLGFEKAAAAVDGYAQSLRGAASAAQALADAEARLVAFQRHFNVEMKKNEAEMERLKRLRDDESLSTQERIEANNKLGEVISKQLQLEQSLARDRVKFIQAKIQEHGKLTELLDEEAAALAALYDLEKRIDTLSVEQIRNKNALLKKGYEDQMKMVDDQIKKEQLLVEIYKLEQSERAATMQQELELAEEVYRRTLEIEKKKLANKKISEQEFALFVIEQEQQLARMRAEIAVDAAARELAEYKRSFDAQMAERKFLSDQVLANKIAEHNALLEQQVAYEALRLEQGLISQQEYDDAVFALTEANRIAVAELNKEREQVEKEEALELKALEFEEELARMLEQGATRFEIEQEQLRQQAEERKAALDAQLAEGMISQELYDARLLQLKRQTAEAEKKIEEALFKEKLALSTQLLDAAAGAVNKESKAGKAIALAKAAINMYQGISAGVALGFPMAIPAVAAAGITGGKAISDIVSTKVPSAKGGGDVGGGSGSQVSGAKMMNLSGSGVNLGSLNGNIQNQMKSGMDSEMMKNEMREAIRDGAREGTAEGSQEGIIELTGNQEIARQSSF